MSCANCNRPQGPFELVVPGRRICTLPKGYVVPSGSTFEKERRKVALACNKVADKNRGGE